MKNVKVPTRGLPVAPNAKPLVELPGRSDELAIQLREAERQVEEQRARDAAAELERKQEMSRLD